MSTRTIAQRYYLNSLGTQASAKANQPVNPVYTLLTNSLSWSNTRTVEDPPHFGWKQALARGDYANTYLYGTRTYVEAHPGELYDELVNIPGDSHVLYHRVGHLLTGVSVPFPGAPSSALVNKVLAKFMEKAIAAQQNLQSVAFIGELGEALHGIARPAKSFRKAVDDYQAYLARKRRSLRGLSRSSKEKWLANSWLEWSFSVKPTMMDIEGAARALAQSVNRFERDFTRIEASEREFETPTVNPASVSVGTVGLNYAWKYSPVYKIKMYGNVVSSNDSVLHPHLANWGVLPEDFIPGIYEVMPYSWLVDYFTNLGEVLRSWSYRNIQLKWIMKTQVDSASWEAVDFRPYLQPTTTGQTRISGFVIPGSCRVSTTRVTREKYTGSLIPEFRIRHPEFSSLRWLNIAALASSRSRFKPF